MMVKYSPVVQGHYPRLTHRIFFWWRFTGSPRFLGSPGCAFALLSDPGGIVALCHYRAPMLLPSKKQRKLPLHRGFRGSITRLQHSLSTLPTSIALYRQDSLPVTGNVFPGGFLPLDSTANFKITSCHLFQGSRLGLAPLFSARRLYRTLMRFPQMPQTTRPCSNAGPSRGGPR